MRDLRYQSGFGNTLSTEAEPGALPAGQNSPREAPYGLYPDLLNGTSFVTDRELNLRVWLYRLRPQIHDRAWEACAVPGWAGSYEEGVPHPQVMRFQPLPEPEAGVDFLAGVQTFAGAGDPASKHGMALHLYGVSADMEGEAFANIDGDLLFVPWHGAIVLRTELGLLRVEPGEIAVVPRAIRFQVHVPDGSARGWMAEVFDNHLRLPGRGPVGSNGLADERHFLAPVAAYENVKTDHRVVVKQGGRFWETVQPHSPFDVVAWHGRYTPYKYALRHFSSMWNVQFDHPDPSILTVLTAPKDDHGNNAIDVAVFLGRWDPTEHTFRPPFLHRNSAIEFNMVVGSPHVTGPYPAGAFSYTPYLTPHGVSGSSYRRELGKTDAEADAPSRGSDASIWVQVESCYLLRVMPAFLEHPQRDATFLQAFTDYPEGELAR